MIRVKNFEPGVKTSSWKYVADSDGKSRAKK